MYFTFPARQWRESGDWGAVPQEGYSVLTHLPTSETQKEMETLTFVGNFDLQPTCNKSSQVAPTRPAAVVPVREEEGLTFVGNFTHPPNITQDEINALLNSTKAPVSGCAASHGVSSSQKTLPNPTLPRSSDSGMKRCAQPFTSKTIPR